MSGGTFTTSVHIAARPADVFPYLTDASLVVRWMGQWAELRPEPGGALAIDIDGVPIRGEYVVVDPPRRVVFTWGAAGHDVLTPGSTTVEIMLRGSMATARSSSSPTVICRRRNCLDTMSAGATSSLAWWSPPPAAIRALIPGPTAERPSANSPLHHRRTAGTAARTPTDDRSITRA